MRPPWFNGMTQLYGDKAERLAGAHVLVVGIGGVGSWTAEALARSGVGTLTLLDGDEVCVTNINRQVHALHSTVGRPKVEVMAERIRDIHPDCRVHTVQEFFHRTTAAHHLAGPYDWVVDAIDGVTAKACLLSACRERNRAVITCGGAGSKTDPTQITIADLSCTLNDPLLAILRKKLRQDFNFPRKKKFGIPCVYSPERPILPEDACSTGEEGALFGDEPQRLNCEGGLGSASYITGIFGLMAAAYVVNALTAANPYRRGDGTAPANR